MRHREIIWHLGVLLLFVCGFAGGNPEWQRLSEERYRITWEVPRPHLTQKKRGKKLFTRVTMEGLEASGSVGTPNLPAFHRWFAVPADFELVVTNPEVQTIEIPCPSEIDFHSAPLTHCRRPKIREEIDRPAYAASAKQPWISIEHFSTSWGLQLAKISLYPVRRSGPREIEVAGFFKVELVLKAKPSRLNSLPYLNQNDYRTLRALVWNPEELPSPVRGDRQVDLILAPDELAPELEPLIRFKQAQGREVRLRTLGKPTTETVKKWIEQEYQSPLVPHHTLLVGGIDLMPSFWLGEYWSDYGYTLLDAGQIPDLSLGRLPARNRNELKDMIEKIIRRETEPRNDAAILLLSGTETNWCHVNLNYIKNFILSKGLIPFEVEKLFVTEGANTAKVVEAFNRNPNLVVYDGHGNAKGMTEIPFLTEHLPQLKATVPPIIFDIACNNAYWPEKNEKPRNFAESIATLTGTGAAGIMASSNFSGGHDLFKHVFRGSVYNELDSQNPVLHLNEVGEVVRYAKWKYLENNQSNSQTLKDNQMFFYLGDPASTLFRPIVAP